MCGVCYEDAVERVREERSDGTGLAPRYSLRDLWVAGSIQDIVAVNRKVGERGPMGINEDHDGDVIACMFDGGIDHEEALRAERKTFQNTLTHRHHHSSEDGEPAPPAFIGIWDALEFDFIHDGCQPTIKTKEILMHFSACEHYLGVWCEELMEQEGGFVARCGCDRFDENLIRKQYAESAQLCLFCRRVRSEAYKPLVGQMARLVSDRRELALWPFGQRRPWRELK
jgi:hypothetical protein